MDTFDFIIVGAGSAGCVLANRLSEDPSISVCLLEAGPPDRHPYIHLPAGFIKTFYNKSINWCYTQEPGDYTNGRRIFSPRCNVCIANGMCDDCLGKEAVNSPMPCSVLLSLMKSPL